jgi:hypothetical protein
MAPDPVCHSPHLNTVENVHTIPTTRTASSPHTLDAQEEASSFPLHEWGEW